jgi:uncharacterized protein YndB with AHSA1/START domain
MNQTAESPLQPFIISRAFDAPRDLVWKAWTEVEHMGWWGPKGVVIQQAKMDFRPDGVFHYSMKTGDGGAMWGKWVIKEIDEPRRLAFVNSFSDETGGVTQHPMSAHWPLEMLSTVTFAEIDCKTTVSIQWLPLNATDLESATFDEGRESMKNGWSGSLDRLAEYLAEVGVES